MHVRTHSGTGGWRWAALPLLGLLPIATAARAEPLPVSIPAAAGPELTRQAVPVPVPGPTMDIAWTLDDDSRARSPVYAVPAPEPDTAFGPRERQPAPVDDARDPISFGDRLDAVKWETAGIAAYLTAVNLPGLLKRPSGFSFEEEGLFGKDTANLGMDKVAHAFNVHVVSDILYWRMKRKTGPSRQSALASSAIAVGLGVYSEMFDAFEERSGFSVSDVGFNVAGAAFSYARNTVPGLKEKLDFRLMIIPNRDFYSISNKKEHFRQERFLLALKLAGFDGLKRTPLRFVELHAGYYARGFTDRERRRGDALERKPFVGVGINFQELFFPTSRSPVARVARTGLEYLQIPYTAVHVD